MLHGLFTPWLKHIVIYHFFFFEDREEKKKFWKFHVKVLKEITNKILLDYKNFITKLKEKKKKTKVDISWKIDWQEKSLYFIIRTWNLFQVIKMSFPLKNDFQDFRLVFRFIYIFLWEFESGFLVFFSYIHFMCHHFKQYIHILYTLFERHILINLEFKLHYI